MDDEPTTVLERGQLATSDEVWNLAVRRAEVIGRLARAGVVGLEAADAAASATTSNRASMRRRRGTGDQVIVPGSSQQKNATYGGHHE